MQVNKINDTTAVNTALNNKKTEEKPAVQQDVKGYAEKEAAPTNANLYQAMYGVNNKSSEEEEQAKFVKQLAEVRAKYEMDVDDKNREIENNKRQSQNPEAKQNEEKSFYEQYLEYKHKYE